jgi:transposase
MMPKRYIELTDSEKEKLEVEVRTSPNFRIRRRSQALLWSHQGKDRATIAEMLDVRLDTVSDWFNRWLEKKLESLIDLPKSGRPSILTQVEKKV